MKNPPPSARKVIPVWLAALLAVLVLFSVFHLVS
jgi:hypothetical protein